MPLRASGGRSLAAQPQIRTFTRSFDSQQPTPSQELNTVRFANPLDEGAEGEGAGSAVLERVKRIEQHEKRHVAHPVWDKQDGGKDGNGVDGGEWAKELAEQQQAAAAAKSARLERDEGREGGALEFEEPERTTWAERFVALGGPGNIAAGAASALHVNLYLAALGMMLATNYFDVMSTTLVAVMGTALMQAVHTFFGSYRHFVISNADTVPGAVMVEIVQLIVKTMEREWELTRMAQMEGRDPDMDWAECMKERPDACMPCWEDQQCWLRVHSTIVAGMMLCAAVTGASLYLFGTMKWGNLISFVPLTVQAAFLAGCGWKITKTGIFFLLDRDVLLEGDFAKFGEDVLRNFLPVLILGVFIMWAEDFFHHFKYGEWTLPGLLLGLTAVFYAWVFMMMEEGQSWSDILSHARDPRNSNGTFPVLPDGRGWLMDQRYVTPDAQPRFDPLPQFYPFWDATDNYTLHNAHASGDEDADGEHVWIVWPQFTAILTLQQLVNVVMLEVVTILAILLNSTAIEEETGSNIDFDRELKVTGVGNLLSACVCGPVGFSSVGKTMLCHSMGGHYFPGVFAIAYYIFYVFIGFKFARYIPLPVLGGFIFAIGMELLLEWLVHYKKRVTKIEYRETVFLFLIMTLNFVVGFFVGIFFSLIVFASRYADVPVIKAVMDGSEYQGRSTFSGHDTIVLKKWGCKVLTVRLQGFIFFFTAEKLRSDLMHLLRSPSRTGTRQVEWLIIDCRFVENMDSTAVQKLRKLLRTAEREFSIKCMITNLQGDLKARMEGLAGKIEVLITDLEQVERAIAADEPEPEPEPSLRLSLQQAQSVHSLLTKVPMLQALSEQERVAIAGKLQTERFEAGEPVMEVGEKGDAMYFLDAGDAEVEVGGAIVMRYKPGDYFGELALLNDEPRKATVYAGVAGARCLKLSRAEFSTVASALSLSQRLKRYDSEGWGSLLYVSNSDEAVELALQALLSQPKYNPKLLWKDEECRRLGRWTLPCLVKGIIDYQRAGLGALVAGQMFDSASFRQLGTTSVWKKGQVLQHQDEWSHRTLWYIVRGQVATFRKHVDGTVSMTELRHRGTIIGEVGFFLDQPRYGTFKAVEDGTETVQFTLENYRQLAKAEPTIAEHLHVYIVEMTTSCIKRQAHEINLLLAPARGIEKEKSHSLS